MKKRKIRFSLRTLLILAPLIAAGLAFVASRVIRHNEVTIAGYMDVHDRAYVSFWQYPPKNANDDLIERTSDEVLSRATGKLPPASRAWINAKGDAVAWMRSNIHIRTVGTIPLLQVAIHHFSPTPGEIAAETDIVNALLDTFAERKKGFLGTVPAVPPLVRVISQAQVRHDGGL